MTRSNSQQVMNDGGSVCRGESVERPNRVVVIGGGPAGLTAAYELTRSGTPTVVLEKHHQVGGLARTEQFRGNYFDLGGHRFFTQSSTIAHFWRDVLGDDLLRRPRMSRIYYRKRFFHYPLKPLNALRGLGPIESLWIALSYLKWHLFPYREEATFEQWVTNRFGKRLFETFFRSYTEKVWGIPCNELKAEWAAQRIKDLSFMAVISNMFRRSSGRIRTLIEEFHYPRLGPGMMWQAVKGAVEQQGGDVRLSVEVVGIHRKVGGGWIVSVACNGRQEQVEADAIISSMPITELVAILDPTPPNEVLAAARRLTYRDFLTVCLVVNKPHLFPDNWIYVHDQGISLARIQNFKNWSSDMVVDSSKSTLGLEYFCTEGDALWNLSDSQLVDLGRRQLEEIGLARCEDVEDGCVFRVPKSYPIYDADYREHLEVVRGFVDELPELQTVGRNGLHRYNNQDHAMLTGMLAVRNLIMGETHNLWEINSDQEYLEDLPTTGRASRES